MMKVVMEFTDSELGTLCGMRHEGLESASQKEKAFAWIAKEAARIAVEKVHSDLGGKSIALPIHDRDN